MSRGERGVRGRGEMVRGGGGGDGLVCQRFDYRTKSDTVI